jgi:hypothetical protein
MKKADYDALVRAGQLSSDSASGRAEKGQAAGQFGDIGTIPAGALTGGVQRLVDVHTKDGIPCVWSICLGAPNRFNPSLGTTSLSIDQDQSFASLRYGVAGAMNAAEVDWGQGRTFTVFGQTLTIDAVLTRRTAVPNQPELRVPCFVMCGGALDHQSVVTRTVGYDTLNPGTFQERPIPQMAIRARLYDAADWFDQKAALIAFKRAAFTTAVAGLEFTNTAGANPLWSAWQDGIVVPPWATSLRVENTSAAEPMIPSVVYDLAL